MSRQLQELEQVVGQLIVEHQRMTRHLNDQQAAMKLMDLKAMDQHASLQEAARLRIAGLDTRRKMLAQQLGRMHGIDGEVTLRKLAEVYPQRKEALLKLRDDLKSTLQKASDRAYVGGRLAQAVLGHLNTVVRLVAGAVERAGIYTKNGVPKVSARIGVMEAVG